MLLSDRLLCVFGMAAVLAAGEEPWKDKSASDWTEDEAKEILSSSPWAKTVHPTLNPSNNSQGRRRGMGRNVGIGLPGVGIGLPGGMGRRSPTGYPGGGYPGGGYPGGANGGGATNDETPPVLKVRWESAEPIREAELKARETNAPAFDEKYYAIAVYSIPDRMLNGDGKTLADHLKKQAAIRREGKKELKPASVEVLRREDGPVVLYLFPRTNEITQKDKRIEFDAKIERLQFAQPFYVDEMVYQGKMEL